MKYLWAIALFGSGIFVGVCNAACFRTLPVKHKGGNPGVCNFEGETHKYGSKWRTENCFDCDCYANGSIQCCQAYLTPVNYDERDCVKTWDQKACVFHVYRKDHPEETCKYDMIG